MPGTYFALFRIDFRQPRSLTFRALTESPRWLLKAGYRDEALDVLTRLRSEDGVINAEAQAEFDEIDRAIQIDGAAEPGYIDMAFRSHGKLHLSRRVRQFGKQSWRLRLTEPLSPTDSARDVRSVCLLLSVSYADLFSRSQLDPDPSRVGRYRRYHG